MNDSTLETEYIKLQGTVTDCETCTDLLRDEIDNLTIQSIAEKETLKIENDEKNRQMVSYYEAEAEKLKKQMKHNKKEHEKIEQEIKNQIILENVTKNARLREIKGNLQRQIVEKNSILIKLQNEHKELRKELNMLKTQEKPNINQHRSNKNITNNVMEFDNNFLIQKNKISVSNNCNEFDNIGTSRISSTISQYNLNEAENQDYLDFANSYIDLAANNNEQSNIGRNQQNVQNQNLNYNQNYRSQASTKEEILLKSNTPSNSISVSNNDKNQSNKSSVKHGPFTNQDKEYDHFNKNLTSTLTEIDTSAQIMDLESNSWGIQQVTEIDPLPGNRKYNYQPTNNKSTLGVPRSLTVNLPEDNNLLMIDDSDIFEKNVIKESSNKQNNANPSDMPRKTPTVYMGETRKRKTWKARYIHN